MTTELTELQPEIDRLHQECLSLVMATTNTAHQPAASYTPFACIEGKFYILVSGLAIHGENLKANPALDIMLIEDENRSRNIYARLRLNYRVTASVVPKDSEEYARATDALGARAGKTVSLLKTLDDFTLYRLDPVRGTLVQGFGKAFVFEPGAASGQAVQLDEKNIADYR